MKRQIFLLLLAIGLISNCHAQFDSYPVFTNYSTATNTTTNSTIPISFPPENHPEDLEITIQPPGPPPPPFFGGECIRNRVCGPRQPNNFNVLLELLLAWMPVIQMVVDEGFIGAEAEMQAAAHEPVAIPELIGAVGANYEPIGMLERYRGEQRSVIYFDDHMRGLCELFVSSDGYLCTADGSRFDSGGNNPIFVMSPQGNIYVHQPTISLRGLRLQHSSFLAGQPVATAGHIQTVRPGVIRFIDNGSGHYEPHHSSLRTLTHELSERGYDTSNIQLNRVYYNWN